MLKLLLDLDECARGRQSYGCEDVNRGTEGIRRMLGGDNFWGRCHTARCQLPSFSGTTQDGTCHTLMLTPLSPMATAGWRMALVCVCVCGKRWGGQWGQIIRCQHWHVSLGYGVVVASAFNWLIVVIIWAGRSSWHWGCLEGHSHWRDCPQLGVCVCVCIIVYSVYYTGK